MLSDQVQQRLNHARMMQLAYRPNDTISSELRQKTLVMVVAPTACGKSYLMQQVVAKDPECSRVIDITTRPPRQDDPQGAFKYLAHDDKSVSSLLDLVDRKQLVQYAVHPTTGFFYGSELSGYPARYNFLETLSNIVAYMRMLPFERAIVIGIVVELDQWKQWFNARFPATDPDARRKRLEEAVMSLSWLTDRTHGDIVQWVINGPDKDAAGDAIAIVKEGMPSSDGYEIASAMLEWARTELSSTPQAV